jgi:protein TonB
MKDRTLLFSLLLAGVIHAGLLMTDLPAVQPATVGMPQAVQVSLISGPAPAADPVGPQPAKKEEIPKPAVQPAQKTQPQKKVEKVLPEKPKPVSAPKPVPPVKPEPIPLPKPEPIPLLEPEPEPEPEPDEQMIQEVQPEPRPSEPKQSSEDLEEAREDMPWSVAEPASKADSLSAAGSPVPESIQEGSSISGDLNSTGTGGEGVERMPSYSYNPKPRYPRQARNGGQEGAVMLRVEVLFSGRVGRIRVDESTGYDALDTAAVEAVKRWRFTPAKRGNRSVTTWVRIPIEFNLRD